MIDKKEEETIRNLLAIVKDRDVLDDNYQSVEFTDSNLASTSNYLQHGFYSHSLGSARTEMERSYSSTNSESGCKKNSSCSESQNKQFRYEDYEDENSENDVEDDECNDNLEQIRCEDDNNDSVHLEYEANDENVEEFENEEIPAIYTVNNDEFDKIDVTFDDSIVASMSV